MSDYTRVLKGLRHCINLDGLEPNDTRIRCHGCPYFTEPTRCGGILMRDAAAAIEELLEAVGMLGEQRSYWIDKAAEYYNQLPKRGEWNNHEVACLLAEMFGDDCACNLNGIDEWLPQYCEFAETCCPNPGGVGCWEQFLKHRAKMEVQDEGTGSL